MKRHIFISVLFSAMAVAAKDPAAAPAKGDECCLKVRPNSLRSNETIVADLHGRRGFQLLNAQAWETSTSMGFVLKARSKRYSQTLWLAWAQ
jgi:hypothetical protein